jgi:hypothetical protein
MIQGQYRLVVFALLHMSLRGIGGLFPGGRFDDPPRDALPLPRLATTSRTPYCPNRPKESGVSEG